MKFGEKLVHLEQSFPPDWHGTMMKYGPLKAQIMQCSGPECGCQAGQEEAFFRDLEEEVVRINRTFNTTALAMLRAHKALEDGFDLGMCCIPKGRKQIVFPNGSTVRASPENIALHSRICIAYAQANALALRKIGKKHDKYCRSAKGQEALAKFWGDHSGYCSFLHSPLLMELAAVEMASLGSRSRVIDLNEERELHDKGSDSTLPSPKALTEDMGIEAADELSLENLRCPICLDIPFKPVSLACSHIFCQDCLFKACGKGRTLGEPQVILKSISRNKQCPKCRQSNVFDGAVILVETAKQLQAKHPKYWEDRELEEQKNTRCLREEYNKARGAELRSLRGFHPAYLIYP